MSKTDLTARAAALTVIRAVLRRNRPLDEALEAEDLPELSDRDRAFARMLATTTLRRLGQIDALLRACLDNPLPPKAAVAEDILRLGVAQMLYMDVPDHAAVDTAVRLAEDKRQGPYKKLINAVLRRVGREGREVAAAQDAPRLNAPDWLWDGWVARFGEPTARAIAVAHLNEPTLDLSVRDNAIVWAKTLEAVLLPTGSLRRDGRVRVPDLPGYGDGAWWVQDAAAALPATLLGDVRGLRVADLCAAPGGKTAQLAARGAQVTAVDRSEKRLTRLRANMARLNFAVEAIAADVGRFKTDRPFDAVLLDAPCSATGTIRRHPDVAHLKGPQEVAKLAGVQAALLRRVPDLLKPGGLLVYCVCSLQDEEGPDQIAALLAARPDIERVPVLPEEIGGLSQCVTADGDVRTLPCHLAEAGGLDGFFMARLRRRETE